MVSISNLFTIFQDQSVLRNGKTWLIHFDVMLTKVGLVVELSQTRQHSGDFMIISHSLKST